MTNAQIIPIVISSCALLLSFYTYFKHDAKIKNQNALINDFQLEKFKKETDSEKKAIIEANVVNREKGKRIIKIYNKGKAIAKNVVVSFPDKQNVIISKYPSPIDIRPQNSMEIRIQTFKESPNTIKIVYEWQDNLKSDNKYFQKIQI